MPAAKASLTLSVQAGEASNEVWHSACGCLFQVACAQGVMPAWEYVLPAPAACMMLQHAVQLRWCVGNSLCMVMVDRYNWQAAPQTGMD